MFFRAILISTSLCFVQSVMPEDALLGAWKKSAHKLWVKRLRRTSSLAELLQVLGDFVGAINEDRLYECNIEQGSCNFSEELIASFACMPQTTSAVALWLASLDAPQDGIVTAELLEQLYTVAQIEGLDNNGSTLTATQKNVMEQASQTLKNRLEVSNTDINILIFEHYPSRIKF
ncbi:unnamed protein product [Prunus armeniaca]